MHLLEQFLEFEEADEIQKVGGNELVVHLSFWKISLVPAGIEYE